MIWRSSKRDLNISGLSVIVYIQCLCIFYVLLTVHTGMILVNNHLEAQFFMYVYFYSLHGSGSHVPIIRRIIVSMLHLVYVTLSRWPFGMQEHMLLHTRRCGWCRARHIRTVHTTYAGDLKTTTHLKIRCRKPYAATQHLMLLMMGVCTRNMQS